MTDRIFLRYLLLPVISGLTLAEGLHAYFSQFGEVKDCCIMRDPSGRSRGFAFLTFADPSVIPGVLNKDHNVDGKIVRSCQSQT